MLHLLINLQKNIQSNTFLRISSFSNLLYK